ncbi:MAG: hypothetical protein ABSF12_15500 [Bryobacteraceae bacterium]
MELGQYPLQIFVSLVVILGAAFIALICDFLKGSNEQLRELTIELRVRREEEQKRSHVLTPRVAERVERPKPEPVVAPAVPAVAVAKERAAVAKENKRAVNAAAMAAMERGAALAGSGQRPRSAPAAESKREVVVSQPVVVQQEVSKSGVKAIAKKDWGSLLSRNAAPKAHERPANEDLLAAVVAATDSSASPQAAEPSLPVGFHAGFHDGHVDGHVLNKLVQSRQPISGLVVSIGVNSSRKSDGSLPESVIKLVESLIGPNDFAAQSGDDEFLLIFPEERGASAQRRLSKIAQLLWDFQLRSLGSFQILFSWGGVEVRSESIEEAIASASERMQETKRGRKLLTMASPAPAAEIQNNTQLRQAV